MSVPMMREQNAAWAEHAPLPNEAAAVLKHLVAVSGYGNRPVNLKRIMKSTGLTALETANCMKYLHDMSAIKLVRLDFYKVCFRAEIKPRLACRMDGPDWSKIRATVIERDGMTCAYCHARCKTVHIDHIKPLAKGGTNQLQNLLVACQRCNNSKGVKTLDEWLYPAGGDAA